MNDAGPVGPTPPPMIAPPQAPAPWVAPPKYEPAPPVPIGVGDAIGRGWRLLFSNYPSVLGSVVLYQVIGFVIAVIPFVGGLASMFFQPVDAGVRCHLARLARHEPTAASTCFQAFGPSYWNIFVTQLLVGILGGLLFIPLVIAGVGVAIAVDQGGGAPLAIAIGAALLIGVPCLLAGAYVMVRLQFAPTLALDAPPGTCDIMHALRLSWERTKPFAWTLVGVVLVCWVLAAASILLLGIGLFLVGIPLAYAVSAGVYIRLFPRESGSICRECGYDLLGLHADVCPECGTPASPRPAVPAFPSP